MALDLLARTSVTGCEAVDLHPAEPAQAGHTVQPVLVDDLDALVARIAERGIEPVEHEIRPNGVRRISFGGGWLADQGDDFVHGRGRGEVQAQV